MADNMLRKLHAIEHVIGKAKKKLLTLTHYDI